MILMLILTLSACKPSEPFVMTDISLNYSIHSDFDLVIQKLPESIEVTSIILNDIELNSTQFVHDSAGLKLKSSYIKTLSIGEYEFTISTDQGDFTLDLNVIETTRPYMISKSTVETDFSSNLTFTFELFGGNIKSLSGNSIKSSDYSISGNQLTIKKAFVEESFNATESIETLVLAYSLEVGTHTVIGYIFITATSS